MFVEKQRLMLIFVLLGGMIISACSSTMSKEECQSADWEVVGFGDGSRGLPSSRIDAHRKACAGISSPNLAAYTKGHQRGVKNFCTETNGYVSGKRGAGLNSVCSGPEGEEFQAGYRYGREVFTATQAVNQATKVLKEILQQKVNAEYRQVQLEKRLIAKGLSSTQRAQILLDIKAEHDSIKNYEAMIPEREDDLRRSIYTLNEVNKSNPYEQVTPRTMPVISVKPQIPKAEKKPHRADDDRH